MFWLTSYQPIATRSCSTVVWRFILFYESINNKIIICTSQGSAHSHLSQPRSSFFQPCLQNIRHLTGEQSGTGTLLSETYEWWLQNHLQMKQTIYVMLKSHLHKNIITYKYPCICVSILCRENTVCHKTLKCFIRVRNYCLQK